MSYCKSDDSRNSHDYQMKGKKKNKEEEENEREMTSIFVVLL